MNTLLHAIVYVAYTITDYTQYILTNTDCKYNWITKKTGRGFPNGCETSRIPHFLDNWLKDSGEVLRFTRRPHFTPPPRKIPDTHFCLRSS
jgi:hypothetical protein